MSIFTDTYGFVGIFDQDPHLTVEIISIFNLQTGMCRSHQPGNLLEILHMTAVHHRFFQHRRFKNIMSADINQSASYEHQFRQGIEL